MTMKSNSRSRAMTPSTIRRLAWTGAALAALASGGGSASAAAPERMLAGISIFAPGSEVTRKFGNPSRILVGGVGASAVGATTGAGPGGASSSSSGGYPGSSSGPTPSYQSPGSGNPGALPGLATALGGMVNSMLGEGGSSGGYPGSSSSGYPGGSGASAVPAGPPPKQPVTLIYDRANGGSLEFTISPDKRVIQIRETGYAGAYGTSRGIKLGTSYAQVVAHYGYPEDTTILGPIINTDYKDTLHCGFQFLDQKLVGIIIASPD